MRTRSGVVICGAYGLGNLGDEAMGSALLASLGRVYPGAPAVFLTRSPSGEGEIHSFDLARALAAMRRSRLLILGGGSLLQDATSRRSLEYYLFIMRAARALGCRVLLWGCGVGPLTERGFRRASGVVRSCAELAAARDADSLAALLSMGLGRERLRLMSDPALDLSPAPEPEVSRVLAFAGLPEGARYAVLCPTGADRGLYADAAAYLREKYALAPVCLPLGDGDEAAAKELAALRIPREALTPPLAAGVIAGAGVTVSSRLHGLVFSASAGVPAVGASNGAKLVSFARSMGYPCGGALRGSIDGALRADPEKIRAAAAELQRENIRGEAAIKSLL